MNELAENLTRVERIEDSPGNVRKIRPRDAATLIVIDRDHGEPRVLVGRRHDRHAFMAGKFVFPGGRIERSDARMTSLGALKKVCERRLRFGIPARSASKARTLALTALRETLEETGLLVGRKHKSATTLRSCPSDWRPFADAGVLPDLSSLTFVARAITPPGRTRRFDTRFFIVDRADVAAELEDPSGPESEFVEVKWLPLSEAKQSPDMPTISKTVLIEIEKRFGARGNPAVPYYVFRHGRFHRLEID
jgi:8-oxo-dGTP pyrophosphatase MutT (NUDIX family)